MDGTSGSTDSSPQHSDSANITEDTTPDNSGAVEIKRPLRRNNLVLFKSHVGNTMLPKSTKTTSR